MEKLKKDVRRIENLEIVTNILTICSVAVLMVYVCGVLGWIPEVLENTRFISAILFVLSISIMVFLLASKRKKKKLKKECGGKLQFKGEIALAFSMLYGGDITFFQGPGCVIRIKGDNFKIIEMRQEDIDILFRKVN